jgi:hypothetical protein
MKILKQKILCGVLVIMAIVAFGVIFLGPEDQRSLTRSEMAEIQGGVLMCAVCADICENRSTGSCSGACDPDYQYSQCWSKWSSTSTPDQVIWGCVGELGTKLILCEVYGDWKTCGSLTLCECLWDVFFGGYKCIPDNYGTRSWKDIC